MAFSIPGDPIPEYAPIVINTRVFRNYLRYARGWHTPWAVLLLIGSANAMACKCFLFTLEQRIDNADHIFHGTVTKIHKPMLQGFGATYMVQFSVIKRWKGTDKKVILAKAGALDAQPDCSYPFKLKETVIVFAYGNETLSVNSCGKTVDGDTASAYRKELDATEIPIANNDK